MRAFRSSAPIFTILPHQQHGSCIVGKRNLLHEKIRFSLGTRHETRLDHLHLAILEFVDRTDHVLVLELHRLGRSIFSCLLGSSKHLRDW